MLLCPFYRGNHIYAREESNKPSCKALMPVKFEEKFMPKTSYRKGKDFIRSLFSPSWIAEKQTKKTHNILSNPSSLKLLCTSLDKIEPREVRSLLAAAAVASTAQHSPGAQPTAPKMWQKTNRTSCATENNQHCLAVFPLHSGYVIPVSLPYCTSKICHEPNDLCSSDCPPLIKMSPVSSPTNKM